MILGKYKHYWMTTIALAAVGEAFGWGARLGAHFAVCQVVQRRANGKLTLSQPDEWMAFMIQICSLIITPVVISAADDALYCYSKM